MMQYLILICMWLMFGILHSLFASVTWKRKMQAALNYNYKFYRIGYSLFALISLILILVYNFLIRSILLWQVYMFEKIFACITLIFSVATMLFFIKRFFFDLSGADVFKSRQMSRQLISTNLYKYVRHPLYSATLVFIWSIFLWNPLLSNLVTCVCITVYTLVGTYLEEKKLIHEFGQRYLTYQSTTPMLVPKFFK